MVTPFSPVSPVLEGMLYQGSYLAPAYLRPPATLHIGCAREVPPSRNSADVVLFLPLDDDPGVDWVSDSAWVRQVNQRADIAAGEVRRGGIVLITCHLGLNRSGLVTALTLCRLGFSPEDAIDLVRDARGHDALSNLQFVRAVRIMGERPYAALQGAATGRRNNRPRSSWSRAARSSIPLKARY